MPDGSLPPKPLRCPGSKPAAWHAVPHLPPGLFETVGFRCHPFPVFPSIDSSEQRERGNLPSASVGKIFPTDGEPNGVSVSLSPAAASRPAGGKHAASPQLPSASSGYVVPLVDSCEQRERGNVTLHRSLPSASSWKDFSNRRRPHRRCREPIARRGVAARRRHSSRTSGSGF
jgi:hypothetical protein